MDGALLDVLVDPIVMHVNVLGPGMILVIACEHDGSLSWQPIIFSASSHVHSSHVHSHMLHHVVSHLTGHMTHHMIYHMISQHNIGHVT